jgi:4-hydroxybenzoate polyprenyltransferase
MVDMMKLAAADILEGNWIDRWAPTATRPYLRLARVDRPIGTWLLLLPCWWSVALASPSWPNPSLLILFAIGALVMRGAGCTLNDIADRDFDGRVARTANRPIPSGAVSVRQAITFLVLLSLIGLLVLLQFNTFAVGVGVASLVLVAIYPFTKRVTHWPQAVLGLTFNWGALLGWAAVRGDLGLPALALYGAGIFWTLGYDTVYAHQDKEDDALLGVKSTALLLGGATRPWLFGFYGMAVMLLGTTGYIAGLGWPFFVFLLLATGHLWWQAATVNINAPKDCLKKFKSNREFGILVFMGIVAGRLAS